MVSLKAKYKYDMEDSELEKYVSKEEDQVIKKLKEALKPCVGVDPVLEKLAKEGKYYLSVVSSSALRRVRASIEKVGQDKFFKHEGEYLYSKCMGSVLTNIHADVFSAATSLPKPTSKPDPAIYIYAMEKLGKKPEECVAVEDSKSGATAAFRANIKTIGYTGSYEPEKEAEITEILKKAGCQVIMKDWSEFEDALAKIEAL